MKHIFTIHSPITFLIAHGVIKELGLDENDVILLSRSDYNPPLELHHRVPAFCDKYDRWYKKILHFNVPNNSDDYINKITNGDKFIAYIDLMAVPQRILITHSNCHAFNFIEEGTASYSVANSLLDITHPNSKYPYRLSYQKNYNFIFNKIIKTLRGYSTRILEMPFNYEAYAHLKQTTFFVSRWMLIPGSLITKKSVFPSIIYLEFLN